VNLEVGPGSVWVARDGRGGFRMAVLLVNEEIRLVNGRPSYTSERIYKSVVLMDSELPDYEGKILSYRRSHLFNLFERLI